jgi:transposase-like protein
MRLGRPGVLRCKGCKRDIALTAGTVMERTRTPLSTWFWAAFLVASLTSGMSAVQLQRQLGLSRYETAFQLLHKLRSAMGRTSGPIGLRTLVEVDETLVGGRTRGKGRGVTDQVRVIGAVEVKTRKVEKIDTIDDHRNDKRKPKRGGRYAGRLRLTVIPDKTAKTCSDFIIANVDQCTDMVVTDGSQSYAGLARLGYQHLACPERGEPGLTEDYLPVIHLVFSNLKSWINGTHHGVSPEHLQAYLNEFAFRFNRRFYPFNSFRSLLGLSVDTESPTYAELYDGDWEHPGTSGVS